jgi:hypothetical protein
MVKQLSNLAVMPFRLVKTPAVLRYRDGTYGRESAFMCAFCCLQSVSSNVMIKCLLVVSLFGNGFIILLEISTVFFNRYRALNVQRAPQTFSTFLLCIDNAHDAN